MGRLALLCAVVAAVLGAFCLAGNSPAPAFAGNPAKPDPPGQQQTPPGQAAKADDDEQKPTRPGQEHTPPGLPPKNSAETAPAAAPADEDRAGSPGSENEASSNDSHEAHGSQSSPNASRDRDATHPPAPAHSAEDKPATSTNSKKPKPAPATRSSTAQRHVILCHRTGSESNPYVMINISVAAWLHGHSTHPPLHGRNDIVLDSDAEPGEKLPESACVAATEIATSDEPGPTAATERTVPGAIPALTAEIPSGATSLDDPSGMPDDPGGMSSARHTQTPTGGVAVRLLTQTVVRGTLPFTGMPLWILLLVSTALVGGGLALRRVPAPHVAGRRAATRGTGLYWGPDGR